MSIRVTSKSFFNQAIEQAQRHSAQLLKLQQQAATGLRIIKPSDDPHAVRTLISRKLEDSRADTHLANIQDARTKLNQSVSQLLEGKTVLDRAHQIALDGNQSSEKQVLADEVDRLIERLVHIANTEDDGQYLYAGAGYREQPFNKVAKANSIIDVTYRGSQLATSVLVGAGTSAEVMYSGDFIFGPSDRQETLFIGSTGAASGAGTDSGIGRDTLQVRHTATVYGGASGVQPGTISIAGDTIIGPAGAHTLTIIDTSGTGASGMVSVNGGPPVAFSNADTNLQVTGLGGEIVFVDTTSVAAGFNGNVPITASGAISTDDGATEVAIDFTAQQTVVDIVTGRVTNIDSSNIRQTGTDQIEYAGTSSVFQVLINLRDDLRNTRDLSSDEFHDAMSRSIGDIQRVRDHLLSVVGDQSVTLEDLDVMERQIQDSQLDTQRLVSEIESADMAEVVINLQSEQNLLQFTFASSVGLLDQSLLDFIR